MSRFGSRQPIRRCLWAFCCLIGAALAAQTPQLPPPLAEAIPGLTIPRLTSVPTLNDFLNMRPEGEVASRMVKVTGFLQRNPHDGEPASQRTEAYLGYDQKNLYIVFVCFDDPRKVRAHFTRREDIFSDDMVEVLLDTFHDKRRAYAFQATPLGIQWDAIYTEQPHEDSNGNPTNFDSSWDTVWASKGKLTALGYVVWVAIPFKSLRFSPEETHTWGIILYRDILRENEDDFWPEISRRFEGRLGHAAAARGLEGISPGRNIQINPYAVLRAFHAQDPFDPTKFDNRTAEFRGGVDSKFILKDSLVIDATVNPDFSQVESDEPQITVNQRFEVFFPEKRPFFLENADYFKTPIDLFFTRRIGDPQFGVRLTGKEGPYSLGILSSDDRGPGDSVPPGDPLRDQRAAFFIGRVQRDIFKQSSIGVIYTDREYPAANAFNRVGGFDTRLKFGPNTTAMFQAVASSTQNPDGSYQAGPGYKGEIAYTNAHFDYDTTYNDFSPGFLTDTGFVNRVDIREVRNNVDYTWRPKSGPLTSFGPQLITDNVWAHDGTRLDTYYAPAMSFAFKGQSYVVLTPYAEFRERLRPLDFPVLTGDQDYHEHLSAITFGSSYFSKLTVQGLYQFGDSVNFVPPANQAPVLARGDNAILQVSVLPFKALKIDNTYLFDRLRSRTSGASVFDNHIFRSKWNWQFNRELSLRVILQYNATLANPALTSLTTSKQFNTDFLITYLVHPGTAIYAGYNSDVFNGDGVRYFNDSRQFFVKVSYLFRF